MYLFKVIHYRCGEIDEHQTWVSRDDPDNMPSGHIGDVIHEAVQAYTDALEKTTGELQELPLPETDVRKLSPDTVAGSVAADYARILDHNAAVRLKRAAVAGSFSKMLRSYGFKRLEEDDLEEHTVDWGHRHGTKIEY